MEQKVNFIQGGFDRTQYVETIDTAFTQLTTPVEVTSEDLLPTVEEFFEEPGINNTSADDDPYTVSSPEHIISFLQASDIEKSL